MSCPAQPPGQVPGGSVGSWFGTSRGRCAPAQRRVKAVQVEAGDQSGTAGSARACSTRVGAHITMPGRSFAARGADEALSAALVDRASEDRAGGTQRRRARASAPRRRQVVVRFSSAELGLVREHAALAGLAVGAWIGQAVIKTAERGTSTSVELPDLLRLHADVAFAGQMAGSYGVDVAERVAHL